jgi:glycosyltransferase involved in cell wall biosynthesis
MISILLATYNGEKYIQKSVESVLNQTFADFELLIGFNGTTDSSKKIVSSIKDSRIKIFDYENDKGKSKTLNKLIKEAKYNWVGIQDDDDIWLPKKLEKQIEFINDFDVIGTQIFYIDEEENITGKPNLSLSNDEIIKKCLSGDNQIANTSSIFKKELALKVNCWDESLFGIEDFDFWLKMIKLESTFINLKKELVLHRLHSNSNFNTKKWDLNSLTKKYN